MQRFFTPGLILIALLTLIGCGRTGATPTPVPPTVAPTALPTSPPAATSTAEPTATPEPTAAPKPVAISETLAAHAEFSTLLTALEGQDLVEKFASDGPFTFFAPTNTAFDALSADRLEDEDLLFDTLLYHAIAGELSVEELSTIGAVTTMLGDELTISAEGGALQLGDDAIGHATVGAQVIEATNGVIYIIDIVLIPESAGPP